MMQKVIRLVAFIVVLALIGCGETNKTSQDIEGLVTNESAMEDSSATIDYGVQKFMILKGEGDSIGFEEIDIQPLGTDSLKIEIFTQFRQKLFGEETIVIIEQNTITDRNYNVSYSEIHSSDGYSNVANYIYRQDSLMIYSSELQGSTSTDTIVIIDKEFIPFYFDLNSASIDWEIDQRRYSYSFNLGYGNTNHHGTQHTLVSKM